VGAVVAAVLALASAAAANHNILELASTGPTDTFSSTEEHSSAFVIEDGTVIFHSYGKLTGDDLDNAQDVYMRRNGVTTLISAGEINGNGNFGAGIGGISDDAEHVFIGTQEQLVPGDTDTRADIYERHQGHTYQVSTGPMNANQPSASLWGGASPDGSRAYFLTVEPLTTDDTDLCGDIYQRSGGVTTLVTVGKLDCAGGSASMSMLGYADTADGPAVFFQTTFRMVPEDAGTGNDLYERVGGETRLLSQGPGTTGASPSSSFEGFAPEAEAVLVMSSSKLTSDDTDDRPDLFLSRSGSLVRVSKGPVGGNGAFDASSQSGGQPFVGNLSVDGNRAYFITAEQLIASDLDSTSDLYEYNYATDTTRLIGDRADYSGASADGSKVFFVTPAQLVPGDTDSFQDVYQDQGGVITQLTPGNSNPNSYFEATSVDGGRVFVETADPQVPYDTNGTGDIYEYFNGTFYLLSRDENGAAGTGWRVPDLTDDGTKVLLSSYGQLRASDTDVSNDIYLATRTPDAYARPKAATPINVPFVPAYEACGSPNRAHAAPLSFDSCNPPSQASSYLTVGTPDANMAPAKSVGNLRLVVQPGNPMTPANEANAYYEINVADVRNKSDLTDYTGALKLDASLQITDKNSPDVDGGSPNATGSAPSFPVAVPCAATPDTTVGSACSITTTANTISPGAVVEGKRAIWEMGQVQVSDGGADGDPGTANGDGLFLVQGVFIP